MDNLKSLMRCVDDISKMIPEGTYLEMCDNLKKVHDTMPKHEDPPARDNRRPRAAVPFQVVQPGVDVHRLINVVSDSDSESEDDSDDEPWQPEWYDEWTQNEDMMRHFTSHTPILDMDIFDENETDEATFENYVRITNWANFSPADRKEYTSKKFEKHIYENYKMVENHRIERLISEARELRRNLEIEISDVRDRQSYLRVHYNL